MNYYVHDVPGRLRVKIPSVKGNAELAESIELIVRLMDGVTTAVANPLTGSVIVTYNTAQLRARDILETLSRRGHFDPSRVMSDAQVIESLASTAGRVVTKALLGVVVEQAFAGTPLALLAAVL